MKKEVLLSVFLLIILLSFISSIQISEIEINPAEGKTGKEWVEIYNDESEKVDISGWSVYDGLASEKKRYTFLSDTIIESKGYLIVEFSGAVLNNGGDYVVLKDKNEEEVDKTEQLKETLSSGKTWQFCEKWEFLEETKEKENACKNSEKETKENKTSKLEKLSYEEGGSQEVKEKKVIPEAIKLNAQTIKSEKDSEILNKNNYPIYGLIGFCVLLGFLFLLKRRKEKNELV